MRIVFLKLLKTIVTATAIVNAAASVAQTATPIPGLAYRCENQNVDSSQLHEIVPANPVPGQLVYFRHRRGLGPFRADRVDLTPITNGVRVDVYVSPATNIAFPGLWYCVDILIGSFSAGNYIAEWHGSVGDGPGSTYTPLSQAQIYAFTVAGEPIKVPVNQALLILALACAALGIEAARKPC